ncbi:MAG: cob(I)yrinic acid a,c-diamide adenosyltransferase [Spirochaetaceae bacterium]|jgi:cob(I)alamin adenosyltransferase|nr:cob(I)yrinic acid a,c-diamide adenosyltransferase [Spirochaetaceae bacterium]
MIHLYIGNGKGKTTAAVGLAARAWGHGKNILFVRFLKSGFSGELKSLDTLGIRVLGTEKNLGFTFTMNDDEKLICKTEQEKLFETARQALINNTPHYDMLVLDEIVDAIDAGMISETMLRDLLESYRESVEIVMTGHSAPRGLIDIIDYISEVKKIKHPFDKGIAARNGIEK